MSVYECKECGTDCEIALDVECDALLGGDMCVTCLIAERDALKRENELLRAEVSAWRSGDVPVVQITSLAYDAWKRAQEGQDE